MKAFLTCLVLSLASLPLAQASEEPCKTAFYDDGVHGFVVGSMGSVDVNGIESRLTCKWVVVIMPEFFSTTDPCPAWSVTDDGVHSVTPGGSVQVNGARVQVSCMVTVIVPEKFGLP